MYIMTAYAKEWLREYAERAVKTKLNNTTYFIVLLNPAEYALLVLKYTPTEFFAETERKGLFACAGGICYESPHYYKLAMEQLCTS